MRILITVPHATCPPRADSDAWARTGNHACDFGGPAAARALKVALDALAVVDEVTILPADVARTDVDMNRAWSRGSEWRQRLAGELRRGDVSMLIDAHSFPVDHHPHFGCDVVLMADVEHPAWHEDLATAIESRFKCGLIVDPATTDIVNDARTNGVPTILVEFSEGLDEDGLREVANVVAAFVRRGARASAQLVEARLAAVAARLRDNESDYVDEATLRDNYGVSPEKAKSFGVVPNSRGLYKRGVIEELVLLTR